MPHAVTGFRARALRCIWLGFAAALTMVFGPSPSVAAEARPNILLIISDDQGFGDFGFNGNTLVHTPNLDRLAGQSAVFRNFVVAAACSPTRAAIYTGRNHLLTGVWGVPPRANLRRDETLMPAFFRAAGYQTLHVGKEDCVRNNESMPWHRGWDDSVGGNGYVHHNPVITRKSGGAPAEGWTADLWTEEVLHMIRAQHAKPWFCSVAYIIPHAPWVCDEKDSAPFLAQGCSAELAACYGSIAQMDRCIGRLLEALKETGQERNTIVAFASDNGQSGADGTPRNAEGQVPGEDWNRRNVARLRGAKATVWENGIRVPFLLRWPGTIQPGARSQFGCAEDILPTLLDLARIDPSAPIHQPFTGVSLRPALDDPGTTFERPAVFRMAIAYAGAPKAPRGLVADPTALQFADHHLALRGPRFKYHALPGGASALYDLQADPGERRDVQATFPEVAAQMAAATNQRWNEILASGRAFRMPSALVHGDTHDPPPNNRSRVPATAVQSLTGRVSVGRAATGFADPADSATYALEVNKAGAYTVLLQGEGLDSCAPLRLELAGRTITPKKTSTGSITFGTCQLSASDRWLRIQAGKPTVRTKPATLRWLVFAEQSPPVQAAGAAPVGPLGLSPAPGATLTLEGKPYRGIGVNYFDCFLRTLKNGDDTSYDAGFATLAAKGIPFARFCATGFWPRDMKLYRDDRQEYFRRLDGVVASAARHGVGLIPSLLWYYACVPDLVGEPMDAWADPNSKTQAWMRQYVREVVTRYRGSRAIWAWEFGNEYSLAASLPNAKNHRPKVGAVLGTPPERSERDELTFKMVRTAFQAFAAEVRKYDSSRLILSGDSFPRRSAWHQEHEGSWGKDTPQQFAEALARANPTGISGISVHMYEDDDRRLAEAMAVSKKIDKPLVVGEFGAGGQSPEQEAKFRRLLGAIVEQHVPLAALWVFDLAMQQDLTVTADNVRSWQLAAIVEANRKLQAAQPANAGQRISTGAGSR